MRDDRDGETIKLRALFEAPYENADGSSPCVRDCDGIYIDPEMQDAWMVFEDAHRKTRRFYPHEPYVRQAR